MENNTIILIFGASITYGTGDPEGGWASRLRHAIDATALENEASLPLLYNLAISGGTSEDIRKRFVAETEIRLHADSRPTFIFAGGGNDAAFIPSKQEFRVSPERFAENITFLIEEAKQFSDRILFQNLTPVNEAVTADPPGKDRSKTNAYVEVFNQKLTEICQVHAVDLIDANTLFMDAGYLTLLCNDGVHPNAKGHQLILGEMLARLNVKR